MDPTPQQREPLPNQIGCSGEYNIRATVDSTNYVNLLDGRTKTVFVDNFAIRSTVNNIFVKFQIVGVLRNTAGDFFVDISLSPINSILVHLSATIQVCQLLSSLFKFIFRIHF